MSVFTSTTLVELVSATMTSNLTTTTDLKSATASWTRSILLTCMILIDISAFLGNLLVICAFYRTRRLQTVTNYFIASLAFADALVAVFVLPLSILHFHRDRSWTLGLILCDLWVSSDVLLCTSSILNLTCISVDRYMAITRPLTYTAYRSKFLARVMILLVWIMSIIITCPPIFGWRDSNRRYTVEQEHRCDLNSARGYVVYSALGSFYIPAVTMIFVYIRIFMVVYDRDNLINKFHENNTNNSPTQNPSKGNQDGSVNAKSCSDISNDNRPARSNLFSCCCFRSPKRSSSNHLFRSPAPLLSSANHITQNNDAHFGHKGNPSFIYRFPSKKNYHSTAETVPATPISTAKRSNARFCRPCSLSLKKTSNLSDEISHYRRNYLSGLGAEYQFRSGDSPCYELKTFEESLPTLNKCRSHSLEQSPTSIRRDLTAASIHDQQLHPARTENSSDTRHKQSNAINSNLLSDRQRHVAKSLNELSQDLSHAAKFGPIKTYQAKCMTDNSLSASPFNQSILRSATCSSVDEQKLLPEKTRINRRTKPSRTANLTPSKSFTENFKQQHKIPSNPKQPSANPRRANDKAQRKSRCSCYCCLRPVENWCEKKNRHVYQYTPNQSGTNDEDDDEKLSSNDAQSRTPMITSTLSLRTRDTSNQNIGLSLQQQQHSHHHPHPPQDAHRRERIRFMKEQKTAKTLAIVVGGFILFWLPFFIMYVIPPETYAFDHLTATLITWLGYFNSVINPFIYAYCSKQFRMAFWNITFGMCIKKSDGLTPKAAQK